MKKLTIGFVFLSFTQFSVSQSFVPFPTDNAIWTAGWGNVDCALYNLQATYQYLITGDTVIGSNTYHQLTRTGDFDCPAPLGGITPVLYMGAFRNDIANESIFYVARDSSNEMLLYDLTPNIGDTIKGYLAEISGNILSIIDGVDSVFNGVEYLTRWHYTPDSNSPFLFYDGYLTSGVGCESGLVEGLMASFEYNGSLTCFSVGMETIWPQYDVEPCEIVTAVTEVSRTGSLSRASSKSKS